MEKNKIWLFIAIIAIIGFVAVSCGDDNGDTHTHNYVWTVTSTTYPAQSTGTCSCGETSSSRNTAIGDTGQGGGKIFYIAEAGFTVTGDVPFTAHYLEVAAVSQGSIPWSGTNVNVSGITNVRVIGEGKKNTAAIIAAHTADTAVNNAAVAAAAYRGGGKDDWFLPSQDELIELRDANRVPNTASDTVLGIPRTGSLWSSTQASETNAFAASFGGGGVSPTGKSTSQTVRAVRAF